MTSFRTGTDRDDRLEDSPQAGYEQVGLHNEAQTIRRDRIRWGPIWAGIVTAVGTYLILQLGLIAVGVVEIGEAGSGDALWSGVAALVAFFIGGLTVGATSMWQGVDDGIVHGLVMWFAALVMLIVLGTFGSGVALGAIDTSEAFESFTSDDINVAEANDTAQEAARNALIGLVLALVASAAGGAAGSKLWPKDDVVVDVRVPRHDT